MRIAGRFIKDEHDHPDYQKNMKNSDMNNPIESESKQIHSTITSLLHEASQQLAVFLETLLPSLFDDWWKQAVINNLSSQQQCRVEQQNIAALGSLDLAALIRVLDQNWYQISKKLNLTSESRHFVKEMQTIRNRWAHAGTDRVPVDDVYRDLDTLQRFASVIDADEEFIKEVQAEKESLLPNKNYELDNKKIPEQLRRVEEIEDKDFIGIEFVMKLYVVVEGKKCYLEEKIVNKYGLKEGQYTPFSGLVIKGS